MAVLRSHEGKGAPAPAPVRPQVKEAQQAPDIFERNSHQVKDELRAWGFGQTIEFLGPEGLNRPAYVSWARERLLGPAYKDGIEGKVLPEKIGEVPIPESVRQHAPDIDALLLSINLGYGHLRVARGLQNTISLLGGDTKSIFFGGDEGNLPLLTPTKQLAYGKHLPKGERVMGLIANMLRGDPNAFIKSAMKIYTETSLDDAYRQGLIDEKPQHPPRTIYDKYLSRFLALSSIQGSKPEPEKKRGSKFMQAIRSPDALVNDLFAVKPNQPPELAENARFGFRLAFLKNLVELIRQTKNETKKKDLVVIATHFAIAQVLGDIPEDIKQQYGVLTAHFQPDALMVQETYVDNPTTYTEREETRLKWGYKKGLAGPAENTVALHGYLSPLSVYEKEYLHNQRREALKEGKQPLTVIATASGVAPAQLAVFKQFMLDHAQEMHEGTMRMVIQCGAESGGGIPVYEILQKEVQEKGLQNSVVLHVAKTPEGATDFFEAVSWAPMPIALLVKGSEMARIAQSLNIPHLPTGALGGGGHEIWNIAISLLDSPDSVIFPKKNGEVFAQDVQRILPHDIFVRRQQNTEFVKQLLDTIKKQTPETPEELTQRVKDYILSDHQSSSDPAAMLTLLEDILSRKYSEEQVQI